MLQQSEIKTSIMDGTPGPDRVLSARWNLFAPFQSTWSNLSCDQIGLASHLSNALTAFVQKGVRILQEIKIDVIDIENFMSSLALPHNESSLSDLHLDVTWVKYWLVCQVSAVLSKCLPLIVATKTYWLLTDNANQTNTPVTSSSGLEAKIERFSFWQNSVLGHTNQYS